MRIISSAMALLMLVPGSALPAPTCNVAPVTITHTGSVSPNTNPHTLVFIDTTKYPQAICNDGSPAAFIIRQGLNAAANRWVFDLQPGSDCYDQTTCTARWQSDGFGGKLPQLTGTEFWGTPGHPNQTAVYTVMESTNGILSPSSKTNPDFWDATQVLALYCSSDDFTGNSPATGTFSGTNVATWNFNGHAILSAVIATLKSSYNFNAATEVLLTGSSSGGVGVFLNANNLVSLFPSSTRYVSMADGGFFTSSIAAFDSASTVSPYLNPTPPTQFQYELQSSFLIWKSSGDKNCDAQAKNVNTLQVLCRDPSNVMSGGYVQIPTYIAQSNYDTWQLNTVNGVPSCVTNSDCAHQTQANLDGAVYVSYFASTLENAMLATQPASPTAGVIDQTPTHLLTSDNAFTSPLTLQSNGQSTTIANLFGLWYRDPCSSTDNEMAISQYVP